MSAAPSRQPERQREYSRKYHQQWPEKQIWRGIKYRCLNPRSTSFRYYGARGITICEEWKNSFQAFFSHVGRRPVPGLTIERIDNNGHYEPGNVKWGTRREQARNSRRNVQITIAGETRLLIDWARAFGIDQSKIQKRVGRGLTWEDAIFAGPKFRWYNGSPLIRSDHPLSIPLGELVID